MARSKAVQKYIRAFAKRGGHARSKSLTAKRRSEIARRAALARWKKAS